MANPPFIWLDNNRWNNYFTRTMKSPPPIRRRSSSPAGFDCLEQQVYLNLWRTYDRLHAIEEALFASHGITPQQYNVLRLLRGEHPGSLPTLSLAGRLVSRSPDITRMLDKLEARRLIQRERPAKNRRTVFVAIAPAGMQLLATLDEAVRDCHVRQLGHLSPGELRTLVGLLERARRPHEEGEGHWAVKASAAGKKR